MSQATLACSELVNCTLHAMLNPLLHCMTFSDILAYLHNSFSLSVMADVLILYFLILTTDFITNVRLGSITSVFKVFSC